MDDFLYLAPPLSRQKLAEWQDGAVDFESVECSFNEGHRRVGRRITNLSVKLPDAPPENFVWTWFNELIVQEDVLELFSENGITGFEAKAVSARFQHSSAQPPLFWEIVVTGWAGMANPASGIRLDEQESCPECGLLRYTALSYPSSLIDRTKWDGSDLFMVWPLAKYIFVTDRVADIIRKYNLTGSRILSLSDMEPVPEGFTPGRLSYWMPQDRARAVGHPLGID